MYLTGIASLSQQKFTPKRKEQLNEKSFSAFQ